MEAPPSHKTIYAEYFSPRTFITVFCGPQTLKCNVNAVIPWNCPFHYHEPLIAKLLRPLTSTRLMGSLTTSSWSPPREMVKSNWNFCWYGCLYTFDKNEWHQYYEQIWCNAGTLHVFHFSVHWCCVGYDVCVCLCVCVCMCVCVSVCAVFFIACLSIYINSMH